MGAMNKESIEEMKRTPGLGRPKVVTIVGSTKFKVQELGAAQRETLRGNIVLLHGFWHHVDAVPITDAQKARLDALMFDKIDLADEVLCINMHGYVGETTRCALAYAKRQKKPIRYLEAVEAEP
jgi:hypothetical protein